ncbi:MAG TPA: L,D-transpeptidase [Terriglobales bacterium]|nr:L,D-transpeptidase [Terriglobales bacterium]
MAKSLRSLFWESPLASAGSRTLFFAGEDDSPAIDVYGIGNGAHRVLRLHGPIDWTDGCVALTDAEMDEVWDAVGVGTPVEIRP